MVSTYSKLTRTVVVLMVSGNFLWADVSYQETTQVTGGAMLGMMKMAGAFARSGHKPTDPVETTVALKGNRMVRKSTDTESIIDLDKQTITTVNFAKKSYSVMTFEQMRQMLEQETAKANSTGNPKASASVDIKFNATGQKKTIRGAEAHEVILTMTMSGTDTQTGQTGAMNIVSDMWLTHDLPGQQEMRDFTQRMSEAMGSIPTGGLNRPEIAKAMAEIYKQGSKLDGVPVENVMKVGGAAGPPANGSGTAGSPKVVNASDNSDQQPTPSNSLGGAMAGVIGQHFGFGRKKKQDSATSDASTSPESSSASPDSLIEMTSQSSNFSTDAVDPSVFELPAGFRQIDEDLAGKRHAH